MAIPTHLFSNGNLNNHLLNAHGIVIGDFALQLNHAALEDQMEKANHIGSSEYHKKHRNLYAGQNRYSL